MDGEKGKKLEFLSIGDYGKEANVKANFLGLDRKIEGVPHGKLLPLEEKWVITISSQYGCSMNCSFCDVPKVGPGINATEQDLVDQFLGALILHPEVTKGRINLHYARMGEPTWNPAVIESAYYLKELVSEHFDFHPVVSTMMPKYNPQLSNFLSSWLRFKDNCEGDAGLQLSINTTDDNVRSLTMPFAKDLTSISIIMKDIIRKVGGVKGRKIALNFALTDAEVDAKKVRELFNPKYFMCKLTPMHQTKACISKGLITDDGYDHFYPYEKVEQDLIDAGFDVIVFIPSKEEDASRITCGNAILSDKE